MGLTIDFLIKHVRPIGSGYDLYCSQELIDYLINQLNFSLEDVVQIFAEWRRVSLLDPETQSD